MKYILALLIALSFIGCSESATTEAPADGSSYVDTEEEVQYSGNEFNGYPCIGDCSGHEAGYQWAEENGITDPDTCGGNSNSFIEGCQSYAEEQQAEEAENNPY